MNVKELKEALDYFGDDSNIVFRIKKYPGDIKLLGISESNGQIVFSLDRVPDIKELKLRISDFGKRGMSIGRRRPS